MADHTDAPDPGRPQARSSDRRRGGGAVRGKGGLLALGGGVLVALSLPPWGWWPLAFAGLVLFERAVAGAPAATRFRRAWLTGVGVLAPSTVWMAAFTAPGYLLQVVVFAALLAALVAACPPGRWRWIALPGAWVAFEAVKGRWPFGGVPLSELAMGQVAGPLGPVARIGGVIGVGLVTVAAAMGLAALVRRAWVPGAALLAAVVVAVTGAAIAPAGEATGESITVAYVQGGGEQGTSDAETDDREVFLTHLEASAAVPVGTDLTVWPENVVNVDGPIHTVREGDELAELAREKDTTLVVGVVESEGREHFRNSAVVFDRTGEIIGRYEKVRRVPFGEYVPLRSLLEPLAGSALPSKDAIPGTETNTLDTPAGRLGVVISWEVFFGDRGRDAVNGRGDPAEVLLNPTNGSSYTGTLVQTQQVASSRLRALETGRWTVQAAPTGLSAFVSDTGEVFERSGVSEQRVEVREVPLREGRTPFLWWGPWPPFLLAVAMLAGAWAVPAALRRRDGDGDSDGDADQTSSSRVVGPSLTSSTSMWARKRPVATRAPSDRSRPTTSSTSGSA